MMVGFGKNDEINFCQACSIRNRAICADLDEMEIALLNDIGRRRDLVSGESLLWEGDEAIFVANVVSGMLKLSTRTSDGREQILGLSYPSDFLGRPYGQTTPYDAQALTDATVCIFRRPDFERFAHEHPRLERKLLERTLGELDRSRRWMLLLGRMSAEERVATLLLEISERLASSACGGEASSLDIFELPVSRQQIADILGLTIETVSRQFTRLKAEKIIGMKGRRDVELLRRDLLETIVT
jgi:CRP/FNR family transcriptional regulator